MKDLALAWQLWAGLAAVFAALTAIFAKVGVAEVGAEFATFVRTIVILVALAAILTATRGWQAPGTIPARSGVFLVLSGLATGASWVCYFRALKLGDAARVAGLPPSRSVILFGGTKSKPCKAIAFQVFLLSPRLRSKLRPRVNKKALHFRARL